MKAKLIRLAERRKRLVAEAAAQRTALALSVQPWRVPLALADHGISVLRIIKRHPALLAGGVALIGMLRPVRLGKWLQRGWLGWQIFNKLRGK